MMTLAYFDMKQPQTMDVKDAAGKLWLTNNGLNRYKGVDFSLNASFADKWNALNGLMHAKKKQLTENMMVVM